MNVCRVGVTALVAPLVLLAGCGPFRRESAGAVEIRQSDIPEGRRWNATLATPAALVGAVQMRGTGWIGRSDAGGETRAEISVANAAPGGVHPWHVHRGQCGSEAGVIGGSDAYQILKVGEDGRASASASLPGDLLASEDYFIDVHASPANLATVIACGNLAPPVR